MFLIFGACTLAIPGRQNKDLSLPKRTRWAHIPSQLMVIVQGHKTVISLYRTVQAN
jgi:hypothetical protein